MSRVSRIFEKFEMTLMLFSGAWGKVVHEKKPEAKETRDTVPLRSPTYVAWLAGTIALFLFGS